MCCCHEHGNDDRECGCMKIYHLMDDGGACTDKAILCRLEDMKKDECGSKPEDCGCNKPVCPEMPHVTKPEAGWCYPT